MNRPLTVLVLASLAAAGRAQVHWMSSLDAALKESKRVGRPVLVDFTGSDWCTYCFTLEREVFGKPAFAKWAKEHVVLLRLDYPKRKKQTPQVLKANRDVAVKYEIRGFPTILFLNSDGSVLGKYGYDKGGVGFWTRNAELIIQAGKNRHGA